MKVKIAIALDEMGNVICEQVKDILENAPSKQIKAMNEAISNLGFNIIGATFIEVDVPTFSTIQIINEYPRGD